MKKDGESLSWDTPFGVAARQTLTRLLGQMLDNVEGTRLGEDIEALHDMRVASRRLRAAFRVFRPCFRKELRIPPEMQVRQVTQALGQVRDQDVLLDFLRQWAAEHEFDIEWLVDRENQIREGGRLRMVSALDDLEQSDLPSQITSLLDAVEMTDTKGKAGRSNQFWRQAAPLVSDRLTAMRELGPSMEDETDMEGLHAMRIAAKRLRYTMEAFTPSFGKPLQDKIEVVKILQEQLGQLHDSDVWVDKLEQYQREPGLTPERLEGLANLIADRREHRSNMYHASSAHWHSLVEGRFAENLLKLVSKQPEDTEQKEMDSMEQSEKPVGNEEEVAAAAPKPGKTKAAKPVAEPVTEPVVLSLQEALGQLTGTLSAAKEAAASAAAKLASPDDAHPKLAKQLGKLEAALDMAVQRIEVIEAKALAKQQKRVEKIAEQLQEFAQDGADAKKRDQLQRRVQLAQRKIKDMVGPVAKMPKPVKGNK